MSGKGVSVLPVPLHNQEVGHKGSGKGQLHSCTGCPALETVEIWLTRVWLHFVRPGGCVGTEDSSRASSEAVDLLISGLNIKLTIHCGQ